ncbi:MAG: YihY/virulence factor BrkB family protein [Sciscionella sp.]
MSTAEKPGLKQRVDAYQRSHGLAGFPFAVVQKFGEDQAGNLAALIAYYAFFSIFPLLLALVTILGFVLAGAPSLQKVVFSSALGQFPIIGQHNSLQPLSGNPLALVVGLLVALWSGLAVAQTAQTAFNTVYAVPRTEWPGFLPRMKRSLEVVVLGGLGLLITTLLQGVVSGTDSYGLHIGAAGQVLAAVIGIVLNLALFTYLFRRLTVYRLTTRNVLPGAVLAAVAWFVLQKVGTGLVNRKIQGAQGTYGTFALVIGLLFWFFLLAQVTMVCAEVNVVRSERLWPRGLSSLSAQASTRADARAYSFYTRREHHASNLEVTTRLRLEKPAGRPETVGRAARDGDAEQVAPQESPEETTAPLKRQHQP